jgi:prepilin-type N-terminal cleavage/methylation domain-containing protein
MNHSLNIKSQKQDNSEKGFTFIELIMVITMIGILVSVALQKMITTAEKTELIAEDMTIDTMRSNIVANFGSDLLEGRACRVAITT